MERSDEARREDSLYDRIGSLEQENRKLEKELKDIKLELSTPETVECMNKKEPLYKWAALIVCENHRLKAENKELRGSFEQEAIRLLNVIKQLQDEIETLKQSCRSYEVIARQRLDRIESLETVIEHKKEVIKQQGEYAMRRHDFLCEIKEILDNYFGE